MDEVELMSNKVLKPAKDLIVGEKFNFNNGEKPSYVWVVDSIKKDPRFPNEIEPMDVWEVLYHMEHAEITNPRTHFFHADESDLVLAIVNAPPPVV
jgi:hypothetical protein